MSPVSSLPCGDCMVHCQSPTHYTPLFGDEKWAQCVVAALWLTGWPFHLISSGLPCTCHLSWFRSSSLNGVTLVDVCQRLRSTSLPGGVCPSGSQATTPWLIMCKTHWVFDSLKIGCNGSEKTACLNPKAQLRSRQAKIKFHVGKGQNQVARESSMCGSGSG